MEEKKREIFSEERKAMIRKRLADTPEPLSRNPYSNYKEGYFHVTLGVHDSLPLLGEVEGRVDAPRGSSDAPHVRYTTLGKAVKEVWEGSPSFHPGIEILALECMPEHLHCLLHLLPSNRDHLGKIISGFMGGSTHAYWDTLGIDWKSLQAKANAAAYKRKYDRAHTHSNLGPALFVHGYNDVEAITAEEVEIKKEYIRANPERRLIKGQHHEIFSIARNKHSRNWNLEAVKYGLMHDSLLKSHPDEFERALGKILDKLNMQTVTDLQANSIQHVLAIDFVGNRDILYNKQKVSLICHRRDVVLFEKQKHAVIEAARNGAVVVSAFISPRERAIRDELISEGLNIIELTDNGFSDRYKPGGKEFYAVAEGRLLQLSCWKYEYSKETTVSREMCMVMNELACIISGSRDDWWK